MPGGPPHFNAVAWLRLTTFQFYRIFTIHAHERMSWDRLLILAPRKALGIAGSHSNKIFLFHSNKKFYFIPIKYFIFITNKIFYFHYQ
jgi:hypothetical protein